MIQEIRSNLYLEQKVKFYYLSCFLKFLFHTYKNVQYFYFLSYKICLCIYISLKQSLNEEIIVLHLEIYPIHIHEIYPI